MKRILGWIKPNPKVLSIQQLELRASGQLNPRRHRRCNPVYEGSWAPPGRNESSFLDAPPQVASCSVVPTFLSLPPFLQSYFTQFSSLAEREF